MKKVLVFGEAERGALRTPISCTSLVQLMDYLGEPPGHSLGIYYSIQALLYECALIFFRVREEGFNRQDYVAGLSLLREGKIDSSLSALCMPGVGDAFIIEEAAKLCKKTSSILLFSERDLYDYLTHLI